MCVVIRIRTNKNGKSNTRDLFISFNFCKIPFKKKLITCSENCFMRFPPNQVEKFEKKDPFYCRLIIKEIQNDKRIRSSRLKLEFFYQNLSSLFSNCFLTRLFLFDESKTVKIKLDVNRIRSSFSQL